MDINEGKKRLEACYTRDGAKYVSEASDLHGIRVTYGHHISDMCPACKSVNWSHMPGFDDGKEYANGEMVAVHLRCNNCKSHVVILND